MVSKPAVAITMGDPCRIGPEVIAKALAVPQVWDWCQPLVVGDAAVMRDALHLVGSSLRVSPAPEAPSGQLEQGAVAVLDPGNLEPGSVTRGRVSAEAGRASMEWVKLAGPRLPLRQRRRHGHRARQQGGLRPRRLQGDRPQWRSSRPSPSPPTSPPCSSPGRLRVVHLTTHRSLRRACDAVTRENVLAKITLTHDAFRQWGVPEPRIAVAALNPHASDGGLLGDEEEIQIAPAVRGRPPPRHRRHRARPCGRRLLPCHPGVL